MIIEGRTLQSGTRLDADLCIIGAGPAALSVAGALDGTSIRVAVFERGGGPGRPRGLTVTGASMSSSDFEPPPRPDGRFGGAANEWIVRLPWNRRGVRMVPLSPADLEARPWLPDCSWPLGWHQLERYYRRAHDQLGLGPYDDDLANWEDADHPRLPLESFGFTTAMEHFPRSDVFTTKAWDRFGRSSNVTVYLGCSVGSLEGDADRVLEADIDAGTRSRLHASASAFVVAAGGLDNPRILLSSRSGAGYGNQHDVVGRYYTDHLRTISGSLVPAWPVDRFGLYDLRGVDGSLAMGKIRPTDETLRTQPLLNSGAQILPKPNAELQQAIDETRELLQRRGRGSLAAPVRMARWLGPLAVRMAWRQRRLPPKTDAGWSGLGGSAQRYGTFAVEHQIEQAPLRANRVRLGSATDEFGRPSAELAWRWGELDLQSLRRTQQLFAGACASAGIGRFEPTSWEQSPELTTPAGSFHPTGATRMHDDPRRGVTDADGRVHGTSNLFVVGSSTFTTGGYANPTLTIVALALRLADHLRTELTAPITVKAADTS